MRYILNASGYLRQVSFGADIQCNGRGCSEYTGEVPAGYNSLFDWFTQEGDKLHRWKIVSGNLTMVEDAKEPAAQVPFGFYKIWQNPAPGEPFEPQTVRLDVENYSAVFVCFKSVTTGTAYYVSGIIPAGKNVYIHCHALNGDVRRRYVTLTEDGVEFRVGYSGDTESNNYVIPVEIYALSGLVDKTKSDTHAICGTFMCGEAVAGQ